MDAGATPSLGWSWSDAGLDEEALRRAYAAVEALGRRLDLAERLEAYREHRWPADPGSSKRPILYLDDVSDIPFLVDIAGVEEYQHRARVRAGTGDLFAAVTPRTEGYEEYCQNRLSLGMPELLQPKPVGGPLEVARACAHGEALASLVAHAAAAGGLQIHPYMGIEWVWEVARRVSAGSGVPVKVLGPPTPVTWIANDKALFSEVVTSVLGEGWVVETHTTREPAEMARVLMDLSTRFRRVGLKRTRCASGMGNVIFDLTVESLAGETHLEELVRAFLTRTEWDGAEDVLVVAWEETELSPSTQMWIPPTAAGAPLLEGIYEQILEGAERVFVGSRPSGLPGPVNDAIGRASLQVAAAFQALGYVGRCSFDLLVVGDPQGEFALRFTECNGRWGGTSTPMHLVERLTTTPRRPPYRAQDFVYPGLVGAEFTDVLARVGDDLYDPSTGQGRFVLYNVGPMKGSGKLDVIAFGPTQREAERGLVEDLPRLLGLA